MQESWVTANTSQGFSGPIYGVRVLSASAGATWSFDQGLTVPIASVGRRAEPSGLGWQSLVVNAGTSDVRMLIATAPGEDLAEGAPMLELFADVLAVGTFSSPGVLLNAGPFPVSHYRSISATARIQSYSGGDSTSKFALALLDTDENGNYWGSYSSGNAGLGGQAQVQVGEGLPNATQTSAAGGGVVATFGARLQQVKFSLSFSGTAYASWTMAVRLVGFR